MRFKANGVFFMLFSVKSHKAHNLVARKQVPFCPCFLVVISSCLASVSMFAPMLLPAPEPMSGCPSFTVLSHRF